MASYCFSHHFACSEWNNGVHRRVVIFKSRMIDKKLPKLTMVSPLRVISIDVIGFATVGLNEFGLNYEMNPSVQEVCAVKCVDA